MLRKVLLHHNIKHRHSLRLSDFAQDIQLHHHYLKTELLKIISNIKYYHERPHCTTHAYIAWLYKISMIEISGYLQQKTKKAKLVPYIYKTLAITGMYINISKMVAETCPWPREMELNLVPENPLSAANLSRAIVGSAPGDKMKMRGAQQFESPNDLARSNGGGSTKFLPSFSVTKLVTAGTTCADQVHKQTSD